MINNQMQFPPQMNNIINQMQMNQINQMNMQNMANNMMFNMAQFQNQIPNKNTQQQPDRLSLIFTVNDGKNSKIEIQCLYKEKMSEVFEKFWNKKGPPKDPNAKFVVNAKNISPSLSVAECGFMNGQHIQAILTASLEGGN